MKFKAIFFSIIFFQILTFINCKAVFIPFKQIDNNTTESFQNNNLNSNNDHEAEHFSNLYDNLLYSIINMGIQNQQVLTLFNLKLNTFIINNNDNCLKKPQYNYSLSNFEIQDIEDFYIPGYVPNHFFINETLKLGIINNNISRIEDIENFRITFEKLEKSKNNSQENSFCASIGFNLNIDDKEWAIFIKQLRIKQLINQYIFTMNYINSNEGIFYIGSYPHEYAPNIYKEEQMTFAYTIPDNSFDQFKLLMKEIYLIDNTNNANNKIKLSSNEVYFHLESGLISCPTEYFNLISNIFFIDYLNKGICKIKSMRKDIYKYKMIVCEDKINIINFPSLNFYHSGLNYFFSLNYEDLFETWNDKYYFLIIHSNFSKLWKIGKPFLKKYQITLNLDAKTITFYSSEIEGNYSPTNSNDFSLDDKFRYKNIILIICCCVLSIILFVVSFLLYKKLKSDRKKRANELKDEDYEYASENDKEKNNLLQKNNENISIN
jgi:hypothetical protein